jgi:tRNA/rRNA methyltransferase
MPEAVQASQKGKVAIIFGNEPNGLNNEEVAACTHLLEIPTSDLYDSMNLATAVGICLYELRLAWLDAIRTWVAQDRMASLEDQNRCFSQLKLALESIGFLYGEKSQTLFEGVKHLVMRCQPEMKDLKFLYGLARQILWFVANHEPKKENKPLEWPPPEGFGDKGNG